MNGFLLQTEIDATEIVPGFANKLVYGGKMLIVGITAIFLVLGIIWLALTLLQFFFLKTKKKEKTETAPLTINPVIDEVPAISEGEIIAAIACAIACAESENENTNFRVVSFRKR